MERNLECLFEHVPGAIYRCELRAPWRVRQMSRGVVALTGRPPADFVEGRVNWADVVHPDDLGALSAFDNPAPDHVYSLEYRVLHTDGSVRWVHDSGRTLAGEDGATDYAGVVLDVTAARYSEVALKESARQLRLVFDHSSVGAALVAPDGRFLKSNTAFCRFLGFTEEEILGRRFLDVTHPDERDRDATEMRRLARGEINRYEVDKRYVRKDGSVIWGRVSVGMVRSDDGRPLYYLPIIQDITERKLAEESLRDSEERYRTAFRTSPDSVNITRVTDGVYLDVNEGFLKITGWAYEEVIGKSSLDLHLWADPADRLRLVDGLRRDGYFENLEAVFRRKDGSTLIGLMSARLMPYRGVPSILTVTRDISELRRGEAERRKLEQQLQQAQKLESLGVLAGGIAHDFNNLLMAVLGHAELAIEELSPTSAARGSLNEIVTAARRAGELCRQMLAYSGRASFAVERIHLGDLVKEMLHLLRTSISKKVVLTINVDPKLPAIEADPSQIRQVVMNLILNASEAIGDDSGTIVLSAGVTRCDRGALRTAELAEELREGFYVHLEVADTGCGMTADVRERIFEPFFTTKFSGRGLGLAALLGIVRGHHGAVKVTSEPGKGSVFTLLFPALEEAAAAEASLADPANGGWRGRGTILFADDEESLRALGARMLERLGFNVIAAADGLEAVNLFRANAAEVDLVILDLTMPNLDGAQALQELRRLDPDARVVLASGYNQDDVAARFGEWSLAGVLQKPYTLSRMRELLSSLID
jgi:two-component system, cell cycle sensor histidine kinase and response regulator CckA